MRGVRALTGAALGVRWVGKLCGALGGCGRDLSASQFISVIFLMTVSWRCSLEPGLSPAHSQLLSVRVPSSEKPGSSRRKEYKIFRLGMIQVAENRTNFGSKYSF